MFRRRMIFTLLGLCYFMACFIISLRTQIFSIVQDDFNLSYNHIATLVLVSGVLLQSASFMAGNMINKIGYKISLVIGFLGIILAMAGMLLVASPVHFDLLFTLFTIGYGICTLVLNMYAGMLYQENRTRVLVLLHLMAAIGLSIGPKLMDFALQRGITWQWMCALSVIPVVILVIIILVHRVPQFDQEETEDQSQQDANQGKTRSFGKGVIISFIIMYACAQLWEFGIGTWFVIYGKRGLGLSSSVAASYLTVFLVCFPITRIIYAALTKYIKASTTLLWSFVLSVVFCLVALFTKQIIFIALTGVFASLFYPVLMALMQDTLGGKSHKLIGFICMIGGFLQYVFMWFVGVLGDNISISVGFNSLILYLVMGSVATLMLIIKLKKGLRREIIKNI